MEEPSDGTSTPAKAGCIDTDEVVKTLKETNNTRTPPARGQKSEMAIV